MDELPQQYYPAYWEMKMSQLELEKMRKMTTRNQERILNSQPFSRRRAYLNRQKCQQKFQGFAEETSLKETTEFFDFEKCKFKTQELRKLGSNPKQFDSAGVLKQLDKVNLLINNLEKKTNNSSQAKVQVRQKTKNSNSTRTCSLNSHNSIDSQRGLVNHLVSKSKQIQNTESTSANINRSGQRCASNQSERSNSFQGSSSKPKMVKIKSKNKMLKVYNPFPVPMAELF